MGKRRRCNKGSGNDNKDEELGTSSNKQWKGIDISSSLSSSDPRKRQDACSILANMALSGVISPSYVSADIISKLNDRLVDCDRDVQLEAAKLLRNLISCRLHAPTSTSTSSSTSTSLFQLLTEFKLIEKCVYLLMELLSNSSTIIPGDKDESLCIQLLMGVANLVSTEEGSSYFIQLTIKKQDLFQLLFQVMYTCTIQSIKIHCSNILLIATDQSDAGKDSSRGDYDDICSMIRSNPQGLSTLFQLCNTASDNVNGGRCDENFKTIAEPFDGREHLNVSTLAGAQLRINSAGIYFNVIISGASNDINNEYSDHILNYLISLFGTVPFKDSVEVAEEGQKVLENENPSPLSTSLEALKSNAEVIAIVAEATGWEKLKSTVVINSIANSIASILDLLRSSPNGKLYVLDTLKKKYDSEALDTIDSLASAMGNIASLYADDDCKISSSEAIKQCIGLIMLISTEPPEENKSRINRTFKSGMRCLAAILRHSSPGILDPMPSNELLSLIDLACRQLTMEEQSMVVDEASDILGAIGMLNVPMTIRLRYIQNCTSALVTGLSRETRKSHALLGNESVGKAKAYDCSECMETLCILINSIIEVHSDDDIDLLDAFMSADAIKILSEALVVTLSLHKVLLSNNDDSIMSEDIEKWNEVIENAEQFIKYKQ